MTDRPPAPPPPRVGRAARSVRRRLIRASPRRRGSWRAGGGTLRARGVCRRWCRGRRPLVRRPLRAFTSVDRSRLRARALCERAVAVDDKMLAISGVLGMSKEDFGPLADFSLASVELLPCVPAAVAGRGGGGHTAHARTGQCGAYCAREVRQQRARAGRAGRDRAGAEVPRGRGR